MKKLLLAAALTAAFSAQAALIDVGGVLIDPDSPLNLTARSDMMTRDFQGSPTEIFGYGLVTNINNTNSTFFAPGAELTFVFDGFYEVSSVTADGETLAYYTGGSVRVYYDDTPDWVGGGSEAQAGDGTLWLELTGHEVTLLDGTRSLRSLTDGSGSISTGWLDVIGGLAAAYFDTNSLAANGGFADMSFQNSWTVQSDYKIGSGNFAGQFQAVPEPTPLALIGVGLLGMAGFVRLKK